IGALNQANLPQQANEENSDSSESENAVSPVGPRGSMDAPWSFTVEPPPEVKIHSASQILAVIRLLKVGGIMIAPLRDKFVKLTRRSEDVFDRVNLLSVSFAPLVLPEPDTRASFDPPPMTKIPTLEQLTIRVLRCMLRRIILQRHNGELPTIGRLEEVEATARPRKRQNCAQRDASVSPSSTVDDSTEPSASKKPSSSLGEPVDGHSQVGSQMLDPDRDADDQDSELDDQDGDEDDDDDNDSVQSHSVPDSSAYWSESPPNTSGDSRPLPRGSMARLL
ncbi:unnamed protein product, partial [Echinostoma caproni]|uniref:MRG domain-containing protein n=1 Tax=Echinostoma caproni TaxID=27848 RepID=A0A183B987_9TREM